MDMRRHLALAAALVAVVPATAEAAPSTFAVDLGSPYETESNTYGVTAADFNGDGALDLAAVNGTSSNVNVFLRQPGAGFVEEGSPVPVGAGPNYVAAANFYPAGETLPDLAVANFNFPGSVSILIRNASGGFSDEPNGGSPIPIGTSGQAGTVASADFNADGRSDYVVSDYFNGLIRVFLRQLTGFSARETITVGTNPRQFALGDFNGDNQPDLAVANLGSD